jgi:pyruvyltransferase
MKNKNIKLWWLTDPENFGDILSPFILRELGYTITEVDKNSSGKFVCIGSTAKFIKPNDTVWGTGIMRDSDPIEKNAKYLAVRGPLTGAKVGCNIYGDPGLLCSHFWPFEKKETKRLGFIPHYVDYKKYNVGGNDQINLLNSNPVEVMKQVVKYDSIISSSLHGIIVAHSYGIPAGWWQPSNRLFGDGSKFEDYARSVDIELTPEADYREVKMTLPTKEKIKQIQERLLNAIARI